MQSKLAPVGSAEKGTEFEFLPESRAAVQPRIRAVTVDHVWAIDALGVQFEDSAQGVAPLAPPDASFKHPGVFEVPGGDYLVAVSVGWGRQAPGYPANEVITLQFETHKGLKSPVYGGGSGRMDVSSFSLRAPEGQQIIGLFGARGGNQGLLIRVGAYVAPAPSPMRPLGVSPEAPDAAALAAAAPPAAGPPPQPSGAGQRPLGVSPEAPDYVVAWASMTSGIQDYARWQEMFAGRSGINDPPFRRGRIWA